MSQWGERQRLAASRQPTPPRFRVRHGLTTVCVDQRPVGLPREVRVGIGDQHHQRLKLLARPRRMDRPKHLAPHHIGGVTGGQRENRGTRRRVWPLTELKPPTQRRAPKLVRRRLTQQGDEALLASRVTLKSEPPGGSGTRHGTRDDPGSLCELLEHGLIPRVPQQSQPIDCVSAGPITVIGDPGA